MSVGRYGSRDFEIQQDGQKAAIVFAPRKWSAVSPSGWYYDEEAGLFRARLFDAAQELLEACIGAEAVLSGFAIVDDIEHGILDNLRAAIALATAEEPVSS